MVARYSYTIIEAITRTARITLQGCNGAVTHQPAPFKKPLALALVAMATRTKVMVVVLQNYR